MLDIACTNDVAIQKWEANKHNVVDDHKQKQFRSRVGSLNWMAINTRPVLAYEVKEMSTKFGKATVDDMRRVARGIKKANSQQIGPRFSKLGDLMVMVLTVVESL